MVDRLASMPRHWVLKEPQPRRYVQDVRYACHAGAIAGPWRAANRRTLAMPERLFFKAARRVRSFRDE